MTSAPAPVSASRLRFIDMARAVAILLMLEGHFVDVTLAPEWRVEGNLLYATWVYGRGLAAPMFFTVTGLIFSYLLSGVQDVDFLKSKRVRRGMVRALELMIWGYLLQVRIRNLPEWFRGAQDSWMQAFHVLQCIAVGMLIMTAVFGLFRRVGPVGLIAAFAGLGLIDFLLAVILANEAGPIPLHAPAWVQNAIKGPWVNFPLAPWLSFTFYGAAIGVLVRHFQVGNRGAMTPGILLGMGVVLSLFGWPMDRFMGRVLLDGIGNDTVPRILPDVVHGRIGEILLILAALAWIERRFRSGDSWFQTIGRNTFPIYVGHSILLYGGIFGLGLQNVLEGSLNPWQATAGGLLFCALFAVFAQVVEPVGSKWKAWLTAMRGKPGPPS